jgi:hypothetical protein
MGKKNITINDVAKSVDGVASTLDDLARSVKEGFDGVSKSMKSGFEAVDKRLIALETGQEDIKLRLDNVAYRFEIVEVQKRLKALEKIVLSKSKRSS